MRSRLRSRRSEIAICRLSFRSALTLSREFLTANKIDIRATSSNNASRDGFRLNDRILCSIATSSQEGFSLFLSLSLSLFFFSLHLFFSLGGKLSARINERRSKIARRTIGPLQSDEMTSGVITIGKCSDHGSLLATLITSNNSRALPPPPSLPSLAIVARTRDSPGISGRILGKSCASLCARIKRARGNRDAGKGRLEVEIRFSVDRYNPTLHKRSEQASRSGHSHRETSGVAAANGLRPRMDRSIVLDIVPDVARITRLQITERLRASAAKLTNQRPIVIRSHSSWLEWQS